MQFLYADETNLDPRASEFFIYGGVTIPCDKAPALSEQIDALRADAGYKPLDPLKFNTRERPRQVSSEKFAELKAAVMNLAADRGVKLFLSIIHHKVATSPIEARRKEINRITYHFNRYLHHCREYGIVLIDTFPDSKLNDLLREKFAIGLKDLPFSKTLRLDRTVGFHLATIGASHFSSVADIALGAFRYAINSRQETVKIEVCRTLIRQIERLLFREPDGTISEISLFYSPKQIKVDEYYKDYVALDEYLESNGINVNRKPTQEPW